MSRIDELKKNNSHFNLTIFDLFRRMDRTRTGKYMSIFSMMVNNDWNSRLKSHGRIDEIRERLEKKSVDISGLNDIEVYTLYNLHDFIYTRETEIVEEFIEYMESGLIENKDVLTYKTLDSIKGALSCASIKKYAKELETQIHKEYEDETWVAVRPLSFEASSKYGSGTKWCTTYKKEKEYFAKYFSRGVLVYFINKITGYKFALNSQVHEDYNEISFWNAEDNRVDFLQLEIDSYLLPIIRNLANSKSINSDFLSSEKLEEVFMDCKYMDYDGIRALPNYDYQTEPTLIEDDLRISEPRNFIDNLVETATIRA